MQAYKLKGTIDHTGRLIIQDPIDLSPGEVEIIILKENTSYEVNNENSHQSIQHRTQAFKDLLQKVTSISSNFDTEQAKWDYLKEKYNL